MAHAEQRTFCENVKKQFSERFVRQRVLDVGSLDINGSNRELFIECDYIGLDVGPGKNVDVVGPVHMYYAPSFDVIVSTECFEHDMYYRRSLVRITELLRPGGLFFFTCAGTGRPEHGTARSDPNSSPLTSAISKWQDYYKNLSQKDVLDAIDVPAIFAEFHFEENPNPGDLYFWGLKRS